MRDHGYSSPLRILLAEDNPADVFLVREALRVHNLACELHVVGDGERAIQFINNIDCDEAAAPPDALLLDLTLPRRDGHEVLARVRESSKCGRMVVIAMTSGDSRRSQAETERLGAYHFCKPADLAGFMHLGGII